VVDLFQVVVLDLLVHLVADHVLGEGRDPVVDLGQVVDLGLLLNTNFWNVLLFIRDYRS
jgi:hypothetical protein